MTRRAFLEEQIAALEPFGFAAFVVERRTGPGGQADGVAFVEVHRDPDGDGFRVEAGAEPVLDDATARGLSTLALLPEEPGGPCVADLVEAAAVAELVDRALAEVLAAPVGTAIDIRHGSRRPAIESARRLAALRASIEEQLETVLGPGGFGIDPDDDLVCTIGGRLLFVGPRALEGGPAFTRIMSVMNAEVDPSPALGLFLAQTNFELELGRLSYDGAERTVWFEIALLGDALTSDELAFALRATAEMASQLAERVRALFGGRITMAELEGEGPAPAPMSKPGAGGYL